MHNDAEKRRKEFGAEDIRFTTRGDALYAILLDWPGDGAEVQIRSLAGSAAPSALTRVRMLGHSEDLDWAIKDGTFTVQMPGEKPCDHAVVLKISDTKLAKLAEQK
jgi:alpha-L-fucosidase